jgi:hypothetical protein
MYELGSFAWGWNSSLITLVLIGFVLTLVLFYLSYVGQTQGDLRAAKSRSRMSLGRSSPKKSLTNSFDRGIEEKVREEAEFKLITGRTLKTYQIRALLLGAAAGAGAVFFTFGGDSDNIFFRFSPILAFFAFGGVYSWYRGRGFGLVKKVRENALKNELLPFAKYINKNLKQQQRLMDILGDLVRSDPETPLKASIKRAMSSTQTLEAGLRQEADYTPLNQKAQREFFEILAEGASTSQKSETTQQSLDRYYELNLRRRTVAQRAAQVTSQAKGTRIFFSALIPIFYFMSLGRVGSETMFRSIGGDIITLVGCGAIAVAFFVSSRSINGATKGL